MKKFFAVISCVLLIVLCACGTESTKAPESTPAPVVETEEPVLESQPETVEIEEEETDTEIVEEVIDTAANTEGEYQAEFVPADNVGKVSSSGWTVAVK